MPQFNLRRAVGENAELQEFAVAGDTGKDREAKRRKINKEEFGEA